MTAWWLRELPLGVMMKMVWNQIHDSGTML